MSASRQTPNYPSLREAVGHYAPGHVDDTKASGVTLLAATSPRNVPLPNQEIAKPGGLPVKAPPHPRRYPTQ